LRVRGVRLRIATMLRGVRPVRVERHGLTLREIQGHDISTIGEYGRFRPARHHSAYSDPHLESPRPPARVAIRSRTPHASRRETAHR
jgi:hypothetical protein